MDDCSSLLCIGLDPHLADLEHPTPEAALDFCLGIVKETSAYAAAFKPNAAFFEFFGAKGWNALSELIAAIKSESQRLGSMIPVILDANAAISLLRQRPMPNLPSTIWVRIASR